MRSSKQEEKFLFRLVLILDLSGSSADIWLYLETECSNAKTEMSLQFQFILSELQQFLDFIGGWNVAPDLYRIFGADINTAL